MDRYFDTWKSDDLKEIVEDLKNGAALYFDEHNDTIVAAKHDFYRSYFGHTNDDLNGKTLLSVETFNIMSMFKDGDDCVCNLPECVDDMLTGAIVHLEKNAEELGLSKDDLRVFEDALQDEGLRNTMISGIDYQYSVIPPVTDIELDKDGLFYNEPGNGCGELTFKICDKEILTGASFGTVDTNDIATEVVKGESSQVVKDWLTGHLDEIGSKLEAAVYELDPPGREEPKKSRGGRDER